ncbi:MAG TPA: type II toxin-antitoxin system mRNA interferase toxin, RelE/StbE family [Vicinamibacteria bacterium]|nr:type II toxin-antitoxin system mRNA interferase toxin, RelE/StbE family [Vicinamibacteria bacterium]
MKPFGVRYTPEAAGRIRRLHPDIKKHIRTAIDGVLESPLGGHALQNELSGLRSYRVGNYRVIYRIHDTERAIEILLVGPRRDIYEELRTSLLRERPRGRS